MRPDQISPLERLFRSAAQAPRPVPDEPPFALEARVLAAFRRSPSGADDLFGFLPLFRRGLAAACIAAAVAIAFSYAGQSPASDEAMVMDSVAEITYLP
jgi:hypothetical protein